MEDIDAIDSDDDETYKQDKDLWAKWRDHDLLMRDKLLMPRDSEPWVHDHFMEGVPTSLRCQRTVMLAYQAALIYAKENCMPLGEVLDKWIVDPGQGIPRKPWGKILKYLGRRSYPFSFSLNRVLDTEDYDHDDDGCNWGGSGGGVGFG